jgi:hypothetical protein
MVVISSLDSSPVEGDQPGDASAEAEAPGGGSTVVEPEEEVLTSEQRLMKLTRAAVGKRANWSNKPDRVVQVTATELLGTASVWIRLNDNLTTNFIRIGGVEDFRKIYEAFYKDPEFAEFNLLIVVGVMAFKDRFGETSERKVMQAELTRATLRRINWESIDRQRFEEILRRDGKLWLAPAIQ